MSHNALLPSDAPQSGMNISNKERIFSAASGAFMILKALRNLQSKPVKSTGSLIAGSYLLFRGITGNCVINNFIGRGAGGQTIKGRTIEITEIMQVDRPRSEVYLYWRNLENLPKFMKHLKSVMQLDDKHSHWVAQLPGGIITLEWDATIIHELTNEVIAWRSDDNAMIENAGEVEFLALPGNLTAIRASITYRPPAGELGLKISEMLNIRFEKMIHEDLLRFKQMAESRELKISARESHLPLE